MLVQGNAATGQANHRGKASGRGPYRLAGAQNSQIWIARVLISIVLTSYDSAAYDSAAYDSETFWTPCTARRFPAAEF